MTDFRLCSTCGSRSQAGLCHCTQQLISDQLEPTIARLRYSLGGDRPSQTTHHAGSRIRITDLAVVKVHGVFPSDRGQWGSRYAIRAGRNLPDKEF
eukprot:gene47178-63940_t